MAEPNLEAGLRSLRNSLEKMNALLAWQHLIQAEAKPGQPPSFVLTDSVESDLRNEYSFFLFTAMQIHNVLNDNIADLSNTQQQRIKQQLARIESQLHRLDLQKRLC